jgi:hypothetical protein
MEVKDGRKLKDKDWDWDDEVEDEDDVESLPFSNMDLDRQRQEIETAISLPSAGRSDLSLIPSDGNLVESSSSEGFQKKKQNKASKTADI